MTNEEIINLIRYRMELLRNRAAAGDSAGERKFSDSDVASRMEEEYEQLLSVIETGGDVTAPGPIEDP